MKSKHVIIPIFIPHKGCKFDCIYCNQKSISGQADDMTEDKMIEVIESYLISIRNDVRKKDALVEIGFYGGSFTGIEKEQQIKFLKKANEYIVNGKIHGIRLSTRPDYINNEILEYLRYYGVKTIELGVQSLDDEVLELTFRGHSADDVKVASNLINQYGFELGIQTMIGLPGDTYEKAIDTAQKLIALSPKIVRIYPVLVIKNTYLEKIYNEGKYTPLTLDDAVRICAELLDFYENNKINVIRVGLQPSDNIAEGADVVAGPFHPAFRQLAESRRMRNYIENLIIQKGLYTGQNIVITVDRKNISTLIGQKRSNILYLKEKFKFKRIMVDVKESDFCGESLGDVNLSRIEIEEASDIVS